MKATGHVVTVLLDGRDHDVPAGSTLAVLVHALGHEQQAVTTAVNGRFLPRPQRDTCVLRDGDEVLIFQPIVGG